jgi:acetate kinase
MPATELAATLEHRSGLLGLAGSADMREVLAAEAAGSARAALAIAVYLHRLRGAIAAMAAAMGGLDALVFTGGVGERSPDIRGRTCETLGFLGIAIDPALNDPVPADASEDRTISRPGAQVATFIVAAREEIEIARQVRSILG